MTSRQITLSIIIVNWNTSALLAACLDSILTPTHGLAMEVIVVDNGSTDGSPDMVSHRYPAVKVIRNAHNMGFAAANNRGIQQAQGRYILLLNSDTEVIGDALVEMVGFMERHPGVGAVGPMLLNPDGTRQPSCDLFPLRPWEMVWQRLVATVSPQSPRTRQGRIARWTYTDPMEVDWLMGAALMVRRSVIEQIGGLDADYWMYAEDVDWCYRIKQAGWKVFYLPQARIVHIHHGSSKPTEAERRRLARLRDDSLVLFYRKHYGLVAAWSLRLVHARQRRARARDAG